MRQPKLSIIRLRLFAKSLGSERKDTRGAGNEFHLFIFRVIKIYPFWLFNRATRALSEVCAFLPNDQSNGAGASRFALTDMARSGYKSRLPLYTSCAPFTRIGMSPVRKLAIAGLVISTVTAYMAYLGASSSWQYYLTVDECLAGGGRLAHDRIRVNGKIAADSLHIAQDRREASFALEAAGGKLPVTCTGPLPDNLAERIDVVVEGRLDDSGTLRGEKVLTRCASKYRSQADPAASPGSRPPAEEDAT
jgi:cytochrome c-type biogenesis protein CcmE